MNLNLKLPTNIISNNVLQNLLYFITLALAVSYVINDHTWAFITLILIASGIYVMTKNIIFALFTSIIITNLLLAVNFFKINDIIEKLENDDTCCSGETFYTSNLLNYNTLSENINNKLTCERMERDIATAIPTMNESQKARFFSMLYSNNAYMKATSICNTMDTSSSIFNMKGSIFKKTDTSSTILDDPNILPKDILDLIATTNIRSNLNENNIIILERDVITKLESMNAELVRITRENNFQIPTSLTTIQRSQLLSIKNILKGLFNSSNINLITKTDTTYTLVGKNNTNTYQPITNNGAQYLLNSDQYFDCSGTIHTGNIGTFTQSNIMDLSNNDFFGTSGLPISAGGLGDASYNTYGTIGQSDLYPSNRDLEMELRRLETVPSSGNVPVNIISSYLNTINSFYEKQIQNLINSKSSTFSEETISDINSIKTVRPTFFTYTNTSNNDYQCEDSITGNSIFKYCGPSAYYEVPKF